MQKSIRMSAVLALLLVVFLSVLPVQAQAQEEKPRFEFRVSYPVDEAFSPQTKPQSLNSSLRKGVPLIDTVFDYLINYLLPPEDPVIAGLLTTRGDPNGEAIAIGRNGAFRPGDIFPLYGGRTASHHFESFPIGVDFKSRLAGDLWASFGYRRSSKFVLDVNESKDFIRTDGVVSYHLGGGYQFWDLYLSRGYTEKKLHYEFTTQAFDFEAKFNVLGGTKRFGLFPHAGVEVFLAKKHVDATTDTYRYTAFMDELFYGEPSSKFRKLDREEKLAVDTAAVITRFPVGADFEVYLSKHFGVSVNSSFYLSDDGGRFENPESTWGNFSWAVQLPKRTVSLSGIVRF